MKVDKQTIHSDCPYYTSEKCDIDGRDWCPINCIMYILYKETKSEENGE
jgi:hypothetical protein